MKKIQFDLSLSNRTLYTIISLVLILSISGIAFAWNSNNPAIHGHTANEIQGLPTGTGTLTCTERAIQLGKTGNQICAQTSEVCTGVFQITGGASAFKCSWTSTTGSSYVVNCCKVA